MDKQVGIQAHGIHGPADCARGSTRDNQLWFVELSVPHRRERPARGCPRVYTKRAGEHLCQVEEGSTRGDVRSSPGNWRPRTEPPGRPPGVRRAPRGAGERGARGRDRQAAQPASDIPAAQLTSAQPASNRQAAQPASDHQAALTTSDGQAAQPASDRQAAQPASVRQAALPTSDGQAAKPASDRQAAQPASNRKAAQPAADRQAAQAASHDFKDPLAPNWAVRWICSEHPLAPCWAVRWNKCSGQQDLKDPLAPNGAVRWIGPELLDLKKPKTLREALPAPVKPPAKGRVRCCKIWIMTQEKSQA